MDGLYTNRSANKDFAYNAFARYGRSCDVLIASAFFSAADTIIDLLGRGCRVQLVVRLGAATSAEHLKRVLGKPGVQVRYFTDHSYRRGADRRPSSGSPPDCAVPVGVLPILRTAQ